VYELHSVAVCCSVSQCVAVCRSLLQCVAVFVHRLIHDTPLPRHFPTLSPTHTRRLSLSLFHTHTHTLTLFAAFSRFFLPPSLPSSFTFMCCLTPPLFISEPSLCRHARLLVRASMLLQGVAVCCSMLQCVAVCCSVL